MTTVHASQSGVVEEVITSFFMRFHWPALRLSSFTKFICAVVLSKEAYEMDRSERAPILHEAVAGWLLGSVHRWLQISLPMVPLNRLFLVEN